MYSMGERTIIFTVKHFILFEHNYRKYLNYKVNLEYTTTCHPVRIILQPLIIAPLFEEKKERIGVAKIHNFIYKI